MAEAIKFEQKRNTGSILEATFSFYKQEFKTLAGSLLIIMLPAILISAILLKDISPATTLIDDFGAVLLGYLIALAIAFLNYIITYEYILLYLDHREITASILLQSSLSHIAKYFWIYLMTVIVLVISMFFFFIPAIYFAIVLFPIMFIARYENKGFSDSFNRCSFLVKNYWWNSFALIFVLYICVMVISLVFTLPTQIEAFSAIMQRSSDPNQYVDAGRNVLYMIIGQVGTVLVSPLFMIGSVFHYFNLVERKEKRSIMDDIDRIGET